MSVEYSGATTNTVEIESSVILKIAKHASEFAPSPVSGPLLGLDTSDKILNISHVFPFPTISDSTEGSSFHYDSHQKYIDGLTEQLKSSGFATQFVGWYQSTTSTNFINQYTIDSLLNAQINKDANCILLVHDISKSYNGILSLRAFRLNNKFVEAFIENNKSTKFTRKVLKDNELTHKNFLVELPVKVHNSQLTSVFLSDFKAKSNDYKISEFNVNNLLNAPSNKQLIQEENKANLIANYSSLKLGGSENNISLIANKLMDSIDDYNSDLSNFNFYQRQLAREMNKVQQWKTNAKSEGKSDEEVEEGWKKVIKLPNEPGTYENLLHAAGIVGMCNDLELGSVGSLVKSFTVKGAMSK